MDTGHHLGPGLGDHCQAACRAGGEEQHAHSAELAATTASVAQGGGCGHPHRVVQSPGSPVTVSPIPPLCLGPPTGPPPLVATLVLHWLGWQPPMTAPHVHHSSTQQSAGSYCNSTLAGLGYCLWGHHPALSYVASPYLLACLGCCLPTFLGHCLAACLPACWPCCLLGLFPAFLMHLLPIGLTATGCPLALSCVASNYLSGKFLCCALHPAAFCLICGSLAVSMCVLPRPDPFLGF